MNKISKKNILFVIKTIERGGGAERVLAIVASRLASEPNCKITVLTFRTSKDEYPLHSVERIDCGEESASKSVVVNAFKLFRRAACIARIVRENNIDAAVCFMKEANVSGLLSRLFYRGRSRLYLSVHNDPKKEYPFVHKLIASTLYYTASGIIVVSREAGSFFRKKTTIIYNPVNIQEAVQHSQEDVFSEKISECFGENKSVLVTIGRLVLQKNHLALIDIFAELSKQRPNLNLLIIGEGPLRSEIEMRATALGVMDKVYMPGITSNVFKYLAKSKLFLLTSSFEGFGNVLVEAMAVGLPVVCNDCPSGPAEILGNTTTHLGDNVQFYKDRYGLRVPYNNKSQFVLAVEYLLSNKLEYEKYSNLAKERSLDFDLDKIINDWKKVLGI